jgi:hypothetical protein
LDLSAHWVLEKLLPVYRGLPNIIPRQVIALLLYISVLTPSDALMSGFSPGEGLRVGARWSGTIGVDLIRKGLFIALLAVSLLIVAAGVAVGTLALKPGRLYKPPGAEGYSLSFKPVTPGDVLHFRLHVDVAASGKEVHSKKLENIETRTSEIRDLPLKNPVKFVALPEAALRFQLMEEFNKESPQEELAADQKLLVALGLFPEDENLEQVLTDVYTEQIAGSYDEETKEITIVAGKNTNSATDELTMSHETTHALQDQNFGLDKPPLDNKAYNGDNELAVTSLIEGDATVTMINYGRKYMTMQQLQDVGNQEVESKELDAAPTYIRESLLFPYQQGTTFAQELYASGGEDAVDRALAEPPLSSEQIMHPRKYIEDRDNPVSVPVPDISTSLGEGWKKINEDCMGEFDLDVWFGEYTDEATATEVSGGWGGNTIQYYQGPGNDNVVVLDTVWDTEADSREFFDDYSKLLKSRFGTKLKKVGGSQTVYTYQADGQLFYCGISGNATLALQATNRAALDRALTNFGQFPAAPLPGI